VGEKKRRKKNKENICRKTGDRSIDPFGRSIDQGQISTILNGRSIDPCDRSIDQTMQKQAAAAYCFLLFSLLPLLLSLFFLRENRRNFFVRTRNRAPFAATRS
jgi:hypothetical protein